MCILAICLINYVAFVIQYYKNMYFPRHRERKEEANARFVEIQAAYERLSAIKNQRKLRNKLEEER